MGHEIDYNTIKPSAAIHKLLSLFGKVALVSCIGALNFNTKFIEKLPINLQPSYNLLHENTLRNWTPEHELLFTKLRSSLIYVFITVDASLIGLDAVLFQLNGDNQMKVVSYISRRLNPSEQKQFTLDCELLGIVHAQQVYEYLIIGSPLLILFTDHKQTSFTLFHKEMQSHPRFYRAQM